MTSHFSSATSTSTVVSNVATSPEYTSYPKQDDATLWNLYADAMFIPPDRIMPEVEKQMCLQMILSMPGGRAGAIEYLEYVIRTLHNPDIPQIGVRCLSTILHLILTTIWSSQFQCPKEGILCKTIEFDNIKVFYHPTYPDHRVPSWNLYIARPGASANECIHWAAEGIDIVAYGPGGKWGECGMLVFPPGARVRISYTFRHERHTQEIVLPETDPISIVHLEGM